MNATTAPRAVQPTRTQRSPGASTTRSQSIRDTVMRAPRRNDCAIPRHRQRPPADGRMPARHPMRRASHCGRRSESDSGTRTDRHRRSAPQIFAMSQPGVARQRNAAHQRFTQQPRRSRPFGGMLTRAHEHDTVAATHQSIQHSAGRHRNAVDFRRIRFGDDRDSELGRRRQRGSDRARQARHARQRCPHETNQAVMKVRLLFDDLGCTRTR